ncbi:hypothetical protein CS543_06780 [Porphyromonas gingivalis]|nr:hypothetical protein CS543_06780 [Porphyromonas gingivalis]
MMRDYRPLLPTSFADIDKIADEMGEQAFRSYVNRVYAAVLSLKNRETIDITARSTPETRARFVAVLWLFIAETGGGCFDNNITVFTRYDDTPMDRRRRRLLSRKPRQNVSRGNGKAVKKTT